MGLLDLVGFFGNAVGAQLINLGKIISVVVNGLIGVIAAMQQALSGIVSALSSTLQKLASFLISAYDWLVKSWLGKLIAVIRSIRDKVNRFLAPLLKEIQIMRQNEQIVFNLYVKPLLNFISRLRQILLVFRLFHLKFAAQLDQDLAMVEGKISQVVIDVRAQLNQLTDYINIILDPLGNLSYGLYIQRALSSIGALFNALHAAQNVPIGAKDAAAQSIDAHSLDSKQVQADTMATANGGLQPAWKQNLSAIYGELGKAGYPALII